MLTAGLLFWCVPIWVRFFEVPPPDNGIIVYSMCWFCVSLVAAGALLILRAGIAGIAEALGDRFGWRILRLGLCGGGEREQRKEKDDYRFFHGRFFHCD